MLATVIRDRQEHAVGWQSSCRLPGLFAEHEQIQAFDLRASPWRSTEKLQTRADARVGGEAANVDLLAKLGPSEVGDQLGDDRFEGDPVKRIVRLLSCHGMRATV